MRAFLLPSVFYEHRFAIIKTTCDEFTTGELIYSPNEEELYRKLCDYFEGTDGEEKFKMADYEDLCREYVIELDNPRYDNPRCSVRIFKDPFRILVDLVHWEGFDESVLVNEVAKVNSVDSLCAFIEGVNDTLEEPRKR